MNILSSSHNFEVEFAYFEHNRMYPLSFGKESSMTKMTSRHVDAIVHCRILIRPALNRFRDQATKNLIEHDLKLLEEVRNYINFLVVNPKLPIVEDDE